MLGCPDRPLSSAAFLPPPTTLRRSRASGDLSVGTRMRTWLPVAWQSEGASTHALVAAHVTSPKPGVTRFYARNLADELPNQFYSCLPVSTKKPSPERRKPPCGDTHPQPEIAAEALRGGSSGVADARRNKGEGTRTPVRWRRREIWAHTHSAGQLARGALAPLGSCPA